MMGYGEIGQESTLASRVAEQLSAWFRGLLNFTNKEFDDEIELSLAEFDLSKNYWIRIIYQSQIHEVS